MSGRPDDDADVLMAQALLKEAKSVIAATVFADTAVWRCRQVDPDQLAEDIVLALNRAGFFLQRMF